MKKRELAVEVSEDEDDSQNSQQQEKPPVELIPFFKPAEQGAESNSEESGIQRQASETNAEELLAAKMFEE